MRRWQTFSLFALSELVCTKKYFTLFYYSLYFLTPSFFHFKPSRFKPSQKDRLQHPFHPYFFFFPLSARGPTRRRNSTGLTELWGGWPIEQGLGERRATIQVVALSSPDAACRYNALRWLVVAISAKQKEQRTPPAANQRQHHLVYVYVSRQLGLI